MDDRNDKIELTPKADGFLLKRTHSDGSNTTMELSEDNVLTLAQSAQNLRDYILAKHAPSGAAGQPVAAAPAPKFRLDFDPLHGEVLLFLVEPNGSEHPFALPTKTAAALSETLPRWIESANASTSKKSQH